MDILRTSTKNTPKTPKTYFFGVFFGIFEFFWGVPEFRPGGSLSLSRKGIKDCSVHSGFHVAIRVPTKISDVMTLVTPAHANAYHIVFLGFGPSIPTVRF